MDVYISPFCLFPFIQGNFLVPGLLVRGVDFSRGKSFKSMDAASFGH